MTEKETSQPLVSILTPGTMEKPITFLRPQFPMGVVPPLMSWEWDTSSVGGPACANSSTHHTVSPAWPQGGVSPRPDSATEKDTSYRDGCVSCFRKDFTWIMLECHLADF